MSKSQIEILGRRLKKVAEGFEAMKNFGLDQDILVAYLCHKLRLSEKDVIKIVTTTEDFFKKLIGDEVLKEL